MALFGDSIKKAEKLAEAEDYDAAAQMYVRLGEYGRGGRIYENLGRFHDALEIYEKGGDLPRCAEMCVKIGQWQKAAEYFARTGEIRRAAEMFERAGMLDQAASAYAQAGAFAKAGEIFYLLEDFEQAAVNLERGGNLVRAAEVWIESGKAEKVRPLIARITDPVDLIRLGERFENHGMLAEAIALYTRDSYVHATLCERTLLELQVPSPSQTRSVGGAMSEDSRYLLVRTQEDAGDAAEKEGGVVKGLYFFHKTGEPIWVRHDVEGGKVQPQFDARDVMLSPKRGAAVIIGRSPVSYLKECTTLVAADGEVRWSHEHDYYDYYAHDFHLGGEEYAIAYGSLVGQKDFVEYRDIYGRSLWRRDVPKTVKAVALTNMQTIVSAVCVAAGAVTMVNHDKRGGFISKKSTRSLPAWWDEDVHVENVSVSQDGERVYLGCRDKTGGAYAVLMNGDLEEIWHRRRFRGRLTRGGEFVVGYDEAAPAALLCLDRDQHVRWACECAGPVVSTSITHDGRFIAVQDADGGVRLLNIEGQTVWSDAFRGLERVVFSPSGRNLAILTSSRSEVAGSTRQFERVRIDFRVVDFNLGLLRAAELYGRLGDDRRAAELYESFGFFGKSLRIYKESGELEKYADLCVRQGRFMEAAETALEMGDRPRAAELFAKGRDFGRARALYEELGDQDRVIDMLRGEGNSARVAQLLEGAARFAEAAEAYETAGDLSRAERLFRQAGLEERAEALGRRAGRENLAVERLKGAVWNVADEAIAALREDLRAFFEEKVLRALEGALEW
ncbi:MAG: soluble NSF attachment family protein, partial [Candidatus Methylomirabilis sp.]|nr:soluble NSF attachment family protein [Deltaproteobacteria bacterium]